MNEVTRILSDLAQRRPPRRRELLPLVYDELRKLAAARMADEPPGQTLQPTALVHEAYLRLVGPADAARWDNRGHFFAAAAEAMRRILVDAARRKRADKHGGGRRRRRPGRRPGRAPDAATTTCSPWTRPSPGWPPRTRSRPGWSNSGTSPGCPIAEAAAALGLSRGHRRPPLGVRPGLAPRTAAPDGRAGLKKFLRDSGETIGVGSRIDG